ncbi:unnamed protein product, partial [Porites lobata]
LTVTKEYKTKQIAKSIDWESCVDKYGEILEAYKATTLLYAMFVYSARREDWIQENDESVFENFRIRPSTRIRIRIG